MSKAVEDLMHEHEAILFTLRVLDKMAGLAEAGKDPGREDALALIAFLREFADKCHHGKEEEFLFPSLEAAGVPNEGGPIGVMLSEHRKGRECIAGMKQGVAALKSEEKKGIALFADNAAAYTELLRQHIQKEDNVLFVMAGRCLSDAQDEELFREFEKLEEERIGKGRHEQFHALLDDLQKIYLG